MKTICVIGNFSGRNAGDAAILGGLLDDVHRRFPEAVFTVPTIRPDFVRRQYAGYPVRPVGLLPWNLSVKIFGLPILRSVLTADLVLVTDAILFDRKLFNPLFNYLSTMALVLPLARRRGIPVVLYNVSLGPVATATGRACLRRVLDAAGKVIVRDLESVELLARLGIERPDLAVGADCALNVVPSDEARVDALIREKGLGFGSREVITFNINSYLDVFVRGRGKRMGADAFIPIMAGAMDRAVERLDVNGVIVTTQPMDLEITGRVVDRLHFRDRFSRVSNVDLSYRDLAGIFARAGLHVGMRTHSLILAASVGTPVVGIMSTPKNRGFMRSIRQEAHKVEFDDLDADRLFETIRAAWEDRVRLRSELAPIVAEQKALARAAAAALEAYR